MVKSVKGVVMRVGKKTITVYTREGEFREIPCPDIMPAVGQVIDVSQKPRLRSKWNLLTYAAVAAVMVLAVALGILGMPGGPVSAAAYVALDINPSVQLYIDKDLKVIKTKALNNEAGAVLSSVEVKGQDVYRAVDLIVKEAYSLGYIKKEDKNIILASVVSLQGSSGSLVDNNKIRDTIYNEMQGQQMPGFVVVNNVREDVEKDAENVGLSVNKYLVYDRMSREGILVNTEDFRSSSVTQVVEQSGTQINKLFPKESCEVQWDFPPGSQNSLAGAVNSQPSFRDAGGQPAMGHEEGNGGKSEHSAGYAAGAPASGSRPGVDQPRASVTEYQGGVQNNGSIPVEDAPRGSGEKQGSEGVVTQQDPSQDKGHSQMEQGSGVAGHQSDASSGGGTSTGSKDSGGHAGDGDSKND